MKVGILAGGRGTRLGTNPALPPKPLVEIGGKPILWHVLMQFRHQGFNDFVIALGHRAGEIVAYFRQLAEADRELALAVVGRGKTKAPQPAFRWRVTLVHTGKECANGSRLARLQPWLGGSTFMLAWSDGLSDIDLADLAGFHAAQGALVSLTAVHPPSRFGVLDLEGERVRSFAEKPALDDLWVNGAYFVMEPGIFARLSAEGCDLERDVMPALALQGELAAFRHEGFWDCMDTSADRERLQALWQCGDAPWAPWRKAA